MLITRLVFEHYWDKTMQNEIIFSSSQGRKVWNTLDSIAHNYDHGEKPD